MLCGPLAEKGEITIPDSSEEIFTQLIRYLETGHFDDPGETITDLLYLAKKYDVKCLITFCTSYLCDYLSPETACDILQLAYTFDEEDLQNKALELVVNDIINGRLQNGFTDLPFDIYMLVLNSRELDEYADCLIKAWAKKECGRKQLETTQENMRHILGEAYVPQIILLSFSRQQFGWIYITCNTDILFHGFRCCGLPYKAMLHVEVFTNVNKANVYLLQNDIEVTPDSTGEDVTVLLSKTMILYKNKKYSLLVTLKNGASHSRFTEKNIPFTFTVDKYKFTVKEAPLKGLKDLVSGLIFSDCDLWRKNRARSLYQPVS